MFHIAKTVQEKYPESVFMSFLWFINPAIVPPEVIDLDLPNDTREIRRSLVMITKFLQTLLNNIRFSARNPTTKLLNPFMAKNIYPMTRFLKDISVSPLYMHIGTFFVLFCEVPLVTVFLGGYCSRLTSTGRQKNRWN